MKQHLLIISIFLLFASCAKEQKQTTKNIVKDTVIATKAAHETKKAVPKSTIINPKYSPESLYGIWTLDNNGPHADFELTEKFYYVVDYDGDGNMPYTLKHDTLTVMYTNYISIGIIKKVVKDTMVISWDKGADVTYVTWKG